MIPRRQVNIRPEKKTIILCIDPDSDSDVVIEEEEGDFRERCIITRKEMNEMLKKRQNKQMMNDQNHSP